MTKANPTTDADATELYVSFNLNGNDLGTKGGTSENNGDVASDMISTASVVVFLNNGTTLDGTDKVYFAQDDVTVITGSNGSYLNTKVLLKTGTNYDVYVIGDTKESFAGLTTRAAVQDAYLGKDDAAKTDLTNLVKFGQTGKFSYAKSEGYPTITDALDNVKALDVKLKQLTAMVELTKVTVKGFANNTLPADVTLKSVRLLNQNTMRQLKDGQTDTNSKFDNVAWDVTNGYKIFDGATNAAVTTGIPATLASFVTYPNSGVAVGDELENLTALELTFQVGTKTETKNYVINRLTEIDGSFDNNVGEKNDKNKGHTEHSYIQAGYIYQLEANVKVTGDGIECTVVCCTKDWEYNEYEVILEEVPAN
ncbi:MULTISPECIES: hypothetical protein [unclassified Parabacteroides]|uniref:hypothetical protein n=1 Tax=unclassified Parabacteroides TaxID=2649774 RepID=UPI002474A1FD|nr:MULTISPECIES: hypothetical protein [unclassified Parabacteroides]